MHNDGEELRMTGTGLDVSSMLTDVASNLQTQMGAALPIAGGIFAAVAGVFIGIKLFKKITGAKN